MTAERPLVRRARAALAATPSPAAPASGLPFDTVALVLQGGGALGAYQAGVCEGLVAAGIEPDWTAGISIGALNTAIIAGNPPAMRVQRLREFWESICRPAAFLPPVAVMHGLIEQAGAQGRQAFGLFEAWRAVVEGQRDFFVPRGIAPWLGGKQGVQYASFYDTAQMKGTLERYVDFDRVNQGPMRVSVGAVNVATGNFVYFDNTSGPARRAMRAEHFMASAALPPGFPAIEIDGEFYWDGGLVSNTPLRHVLEAIPRRDTLAFQVDLWSARGPLPDNVYDAQERQKDILYSSRTRAITDFMADAQRYRRLLREVLEHVPAPVRATDPWCRKAEQLACGRQYVVLHLIYQGKEWGGMAKDYEFGPQTMRAHWASGLRDIQGTLAQRAWLERPPAETEFVTHDLHRGG
ncbi:MAG TPA: patatin-like phospholipase family protein [Ideonella sp.]|nr:patatin-like phospholipase family protein [Ideonella sp.]